MKIVVIGGSGLVGSKLVAELAARGHETAAASPSVDTLTGNGLADALAGASVVIDVSNAPTIEHVDTSTRNLLAAEAAAGVRHHVAVSVVATQEELIKASSIPYTIARAARDIAADDAVGALAEIAVGAPVNGVVEIHC